MILTETGGVTGGSALELELELVVDTGGSALELELELELVVDCASKSREKRDAMISIERRRVQCQLCTGEQNNPYLVRVRDGEGQEWFVIVMMMRYM